MSELSKDISSLLEVEEQIKQLQSKKKTLEDVIYNKISGDVTSQLEEKDYGVGTANIKVDDYKIKVTIGKDVSYDQNGLKTMYHLFKGQGRDPDEYIKVEYDVSESKYKAWPSELQKMFEAYRTVKPSKPKIKIEA